MTYIAIWLTLGPSILKLFIDSYKLYCVYLTLFFSFWVDRNTIEVDTRPIEHLIVPVLIIILKCTRIWTN